MTFPGDGEGLRTGPHSTWSLRRCRGFRVEGPGGRIGVVEDVLPRAPDSSPAFVVVRAGRRSQVLLLIAAEDVEEVVPLEELVTLREPRIRGTGFAA